MSAVGVSERLCRVCDKPLPPYAGRGRPRLEHEGCKSDGTARPAGRRSPRQRTSRPRPVRAVDLPPRASASDVEKLVAANTAMVRAIAVDMRHHIPHAEFDDFMSDGLLGLFQAAQRYDPESTVPFRAYARQRVKGAMVDGYRQRNGYIRSAGMSMRTVSLDSLADMDSILPGAHASAEDVAVEADMADAVIMFVQALPYRERSYIVAILNDEYGACVRLAKKFGVSESRISQYPSDLRRVLTCSSRKYHKQRQAIRDLFFELFGTEAVPTFDPTTHAKPAGPRTSACIRCGATVVQREEQGRLRLRCYEPCEIAA